MFVLPFERTEEDKIIKDHRDFFSRYYIPNVKIKDFNVLINERSFFDLPLKNQEEAYETVMSMSRNID